MLQRTLLAVAALGLAQQAEAHGIAGNRLFPGTITFDDPAVADELQVFAIDTRHGFDSGPSFTVLDRAVYGSFQRLLTEDTAFSVSTGGIARSAAALPARTGLDQTSLALKHRVYRDELHETLVSASLSWGIGGTGSRRVGANGPDTLAPAITFGKGFGDLPDALAWLRPFAVAGAIAYEVPLSPRSRNLGIDATTGQIGTVTGTNVPTLHWGFALEYSTLYLTERFAPGRLPKEEPLHQLVPLVEFAFDTPRGQRTAATMNPGLAYVEDVWQLSAEAIVPLNRAGGHGLGFRTQILIFLDDFAPAVFGKPILTR